MRIILRRHDAAVLGNRLKEQFNSNQNQKSIDRIEGNCARSSIRSVGVVCLSNVGCAAGSQECMNF